MGGRGYHNDVKGYLNSNKRTVEYAKINELSNDRIDYIRDVTSPKAPLTPEFSNSPNKVYVLLSKDGTKIKSITKYNQNHEQAYTIHLDHSHHGQPVHVHKGTGSGRGSIPVTAEHKKLINEVTSIFKKWRH